VHSGGTVDVFGTTESSTVELGGVQTIMSGGVAQHVTLTGGLVKVKSGGSADEVTFAGGGTLQLNASVTFTGTISGFGLPDQLDLRDIYFGANTTKSYFDAPSHTSGTLNVSDGVHTAHITFVGSYVLAKFTLSSDGFGGTLVTDPPLTASVSAATVLDEQYELLLTGVGKTGLIEAGTAYIAGFNATEGDKLDLTKLLAGAPIAQDLTNLSDFVRVAGYAANDAGFGAGTQTMLEISGPGGQAIVHLEGSGKLELKDLLANNGLILPPH
jgi:autotransporter passenger strand-loop-strand repeat protein